MGVGVGVYAVVAVAVVGVVDVVVVGVGGVDVAVALAVMARIAATVACCILNSSKELCTSTQTRTYIYSAKKVGARSRGGRMC